MLVGGRGCDVDARMQRGPGLGSRDVGLVEQAGAVLGQLDTECVQGGMRLVAECLDLGDLPLCLVERIEAGVQDRKSVV